MGRKTEKRLARAARDSAANVPKGISGQIAAVAARDGRIADRSDKHQNVAVSVFNADPKRYLWNEWTQTELHDLLDFLKYLEGYTWPMIYKSGGKRDKSGLAYAVLAKDILGALPASITKDTTVFELRVCGKKRVVCFRVGNVCHLFWFDRNHDVTG